MTFQLAPDAQTYDCRKAFADTLIELARADERIVAVCNDSVGSSNLVAFREEFPDRLINVGIAEQDLVGVGAGLANGGLVPFVSAAAPFLTGRALEQIKADAAYSNVHVVLCGQSPGMAYGELGPTHHSIEDYAWLRPLGIPVIAPADAWETAEAVKWAATHDGPVYLRLSRMPVPDLDIPNRVFRMGKAEVVRDGGDVTIIAIGTTVHLAAGAADLLATEGIAARVLNMSTLTPLDEEALHAAAATRRVEARAHLARYPSASVGAGRADHLGERAQRRRIRAGVSDRRDHALRSRRNAHRDAPLQTARVRERSAHARAGTRTGRDDCARVRSRRSRTQRGRVRVQVRRVARVSRQARKLARIKRRLCIAIEEIDASACTR